MFLENSSKISPQNRVSQFTTLDNHYLLLKLIIKKILFYLDGDENNHFNIFNFRITCLAFCFVIQTEATKQSFSNKRKKVTK